MSRGWGPRLVVAVLVLWFVMPLVPVVMWSFAERWTFPAVLPQQWGLRGWGLAGEAGVIPAVTRSLVVGSVVAALSVTLGLAAARTLAWPRVPGRSAWRFALGIVLLAPVALPPFALAMGLDVLLLRLQVPGAVALIALLTVFALPYTTYTLRAGFLALDAQIEDQARMLGAGPTRAFLTVTLPALAPAVLPAAFLAFLIGWSDYIVTVVITGGRFTTLPVLLGSAASRTGNEPVLGVLSLVSTALPLAVVLLGGVIMRRTTSRETTVEEGHVS
jgi:putative spermidine/putrescine transport system permease protein